MEGTDENPDAPRLVGDDNPDVSKTPKAVRTGYPIEEVLRPLTLPAVTSEVGLGARAVFKNFDSGFQLRARYGITRQAQLGLKYDIGGVYRDPTSIKNGFNTGKAVALDFTYLLKDWVAGHLTLPAYIQPFAMAMTLGAPMKFTFKDKFSIVTLDDFLDIRFTKFIPSLDDERANEQSVNDVDTGTTTASAIIHVRGGIIYQQAPNLAIKGNVALSFPQGTSDTFRTSTNAYQLEAIVQYSPMAKMDVIGRLGFDDLAHAVDSLGLVIAAAYRI